MPVLYIQFETDADVDAALEALEEASQEGYIENPFNTHRLVPEEKRYDEEIYWD
jgi:hypothetical protein